MISENKPVKKNTFRWVGISALYLTLALSDGLLTYVNTPDLTREGNPMVKYWGFGWLELFLVNAAIFALFAAAAWYNYSRYKTQVSSAVNLREYFSFLLFERTDKFIWTLYRIPKKWAAIFAACGFALCWGLIAGRAILVFEWLLETLNVRWMTYYQFKLLLPFKRLDIWVGSIIVITFFFIWVRRQFVLSCSMKEKQEIMESATS